MASSLPGIGISMSTGSEFESTTAAIGIPSFLASRMAISSLLVSITTNMSGRPPISLIPPSARSSLLRWRVSLSSSFLVMPPLSSELNCVSRSRRVLIDWEIVFQLVNMPPNQRWLT